MSTGFMKGVSSIGPEGWVELVAGQVYGDERHSGQRDDEKKYPRRYEVVYVDEHRILLRSTTDDEYRYERRSQFEDGLGNRWKLIEDANESDELQTLPSVSPLIAILRQQQTSYEQQQGREAQHKVDAFAEAIELLRSYQSTPVDWTAVNGIGEATAQSLQDSDIESDIDLQAASDEQLLAIDGVGEETLERLQKYASEG